LRNESNPDTIRNALSKGNWIAGELERISGLSPSPFLSRQR
jgi:hypothetical protein